MSARNRFLKSGAMLTAVALAMRTVAMFFGAFISRRVGAEGTGLYTIVMTVYSFAVTLATSGISLTVTRLVAAAIGEGKEKDTGKIMRGAVLYALLFGAFSVRDFSARAFCSTDARLSRLKSSPSRLFPPRSARFSAVISSE